MGTKFTVDDNGVVTITNNLIVDSNVLKVDTTLNRVGVNVTNPAYPADIAGDLNLSSGSVYRINGNQITSAALADVASGGLLSAQIWVGSAANVATGQAVTGDIAINNAGVVSIASNVIVDADINTGAAIAGSKIDPNFVAQNVVTTGTGIFGGSSQNASAVLQADSTTKGFLAPRMTQAQRNLIGTPATGLLIYQTDNTPGYYYYDGAVWNQVGSGGGGTGVEHYETYTASASQTVFNLTTTYTADGKNLKVFVNGQYMQIGGSNDYVETDTDTITFNYGLAAGDVVQCFWTTSPSSILTPTAGTERRENFSAAGGSETFTLTTGTYTLGGKNLKVYVNGQLQKYTTNYTEASTSSFTISSGLTAGDNVEAVWLEATPGLISYTPFTEVRENYVVGTASGNYTGSTTVFDLTNTYTTGGQNLKVYVDGVLMYLTDDYTETTNQRVTFGTALATSQKVAFHFMKQTGVMGQTIDNRGEFVATAGQTFFPLSFSFELGGYMLVFNDGVLMKLGEDYVETSTSSITFATGRQVGSKVTCLARTTAAAGNADTVDGYHATYMLDTMDTAALAAMF